MLPHPNDLPAFRRELGTHRIVVIPVPIDLGRPVFDIGFGHDEVLWTAVPEAAVYEHGDLSFGEDYVSA